MRLTVVSLCTGRVITSKYTMGQVPRGSLANMILRSLERHWSPRVNSDTPAIIDGLSGAVTTRGQLRQQILACSGWFSKHSQPGDVIGVCLPNLPHFLPPVLGGLAANCKVSLLNPIYTVQEMKHTISLTDPKVVVTTNISLPTIAAALGQDTNNSPHYVLLGDPKDVKVCAPDQLIPYPQLLAHPAENLATPQSVSDLEAVEEMVALMPFSSGTTGLPKAVCLTNRTCTHYQAMLETDMFSTIRPGSNMLCLLPMFHMYGMSMALTCILKGAAITTLPRFTLDSLLNGVQEHKITHLPVVPPIAAVLATDQTVDNYDLSSVESIMCAAAPLSKELQNRLAARLNVGAIRNGWGLSEFAGAAIVPPPTASSDLMEKGSIGNVMPSLEVRVIDVETGKDVSGPDHSGELLVKGPTLMKGYLGNAGATAATIDEDGWLHTGDIGHYDQDENFYITDRLKELIKYKAWQIAPAELEAVILGLDGVADVAILGVESPEEGAGEVPKAFVVKNKQKKSGVELTEEKVADYVKGCVSSYKELRGGVVFIDAIPRSLAGKILRRELKKL